MKAKIFCAPKSQTVSLVTAVLALGLFSANAQVQVSEQFNYTGSFLTNSGPAATSANGGSGWAAASTWSTANDVATISPGLTYGSLSTSGGALSVVGGPFAGTGLNTTTTSIRALNSTLGTMGAANGGVLWMSFLFQGLNLSPSTGIFRQTSLGFYVGTGEKLDIGIPNITTANTFNPYLSLWGSSFLAGSPITPGATLSASTTAANMPLQSTVLGNQGNTLMIVAKLTLDNTTTTGDQISLWINPSDLSSAPSGAPDITLSTALQDLSGINTIRFSGNNTNATSAAVGGEGIYDEFRIGDTFADVAPVPEPASIALAIIGGTGVLALIRRRKNS